ncbi:MAG: response regulator transcription factor [Deltaproteobacteria bacterium]|nr:response regulator transcription factor [Deltaproteobacteria bacterium]
MKNYKIILADDHALIRRGLKKIIESESNMRVVGEAKDGLELIKLLKIQPADLILLDISMPNLRGIEAVNEVKNINPQAKILILTMHSSKEFLYSAVQAGCDGYVLKEDSDVELLTAIRHCMQGKFYISPVLSDCYLPEELARIRAGAKVNGERLTNREKQIIALVSAGNKSKEISELLRISIRTVEHHRANIMRKIGAKNTAEMIMYAVQHGFVPEPFFKEF